jgi:hypothetical protein
MSSIRRLAGRLGAIERMLMTLITRRRVECFALLDLEGKDKINGERREAILKLKKEYDREILRLGELKLYLRTRDLRKIVNDQVDVIRETDTLPCLADTIFGFMNDHGVQCDFKSRSWVDGGGMSNINDFMYFVFGDSFSKRGAESYHGMYRLLSQGLHSLFGGKTKFGGHVCFAMPNGTVFDPDRPVNYNFKVGKNKCAIISALYGFLFGSGYDDREIRHFMGSRYFTLNFIIAFACIITQVNWATVTPHPIRYYRLQ